MDVYHISNNSEFLSILNGCFGDVLRDFVCRTKDSRMFLRTYTRCSV